MQQSHDSNVKHSVFNDRERVKRVGLFLADQVISGLFVGPLTVFVWWGSWSYLNAHLFPSRQDISGFVCLVIGNLGLTTLALTQVFWKGRLSRDRAVHWVFGYHLYTVVCTFFNICHWRGMWTILDFYTGVSYRSCWITYAIGQGSLWIFRCSRNAQAPPMIVVYDRDPEFFTYTTRFRVKPQLSERFVLDVLFTVFGVHQLVVFYWRGSWQLMDLYIFPDNKTHSALVSLAIAYGLMLVLCVVQPLFNSVYHRHASKDPARRFLLCWLLEVVCFFFSNFVSVGLWRGVWMLCDAYVLPDRPDVGHGVILATGVVGLMVMMCGHSLAIRGCDIDGDFLSDGDDVALSPNFYLRRFYAGYASRKQISSSTPADAQNNAETTGGPWTTTHFDGEARQEKKADIIGV